ncbi:hypothetical protein SSCG_06279 [Streptomyces clavuligerus]|nr:hypothetical protein SSCG_06279 [Streptomyces clavuligerus]
MWCCSPEKQKKTFTALARRCAADPFPARVEHGAPLTRLIGDAVPVADQEAQPSPEPPDGAFGIG